jgi:hypothetical protein
VTRLLRDARIGAITEINRRFLRRRESLDR